MYAAGGTLLSQNPSIGAGTAVAPDVILLKRAVLAFRSGEKQTARELLIEAAEHNPDNELVWLWRASAARTRGEAYEAVARVLELNPSNEKAQQWIAKLRPSFSEPPKQQAAPARVEEEVEEQAAEEHDAADSAAVAETEQETAASLLEREEEAHEDRPRPRPVQVEDSYWRPSEQAEAEQDEREEAEPVATLPQRDEADARLAELEAALASETVSEESEPETANEITGYGWGAHHEPADEDESSQDSETADAWAKLSRAEDDADEQSDSEEDPLIALLGAKDRDALDAEREEEASAAEADSRAQADAVERAETVAENDVWASLGMASMEVAEAPAKPQAPLAKAAAASANPAEIEDAPRVESAPALPPQRAEEDHDFPTCFICEKFAKPQDGMCSACRAIVDLKLLDLAPRHEGAERNQLNRALETLREQIEDKPSADLYVKAALVSLNLRQSQQAMGFLREAIRLRPHDQELVNYYSQIEKRPLILAVDDSKTVQKMISTVLEKESYRIIQAEDGLGALAKLDEEMPSLILLDITMPRMDGYQVCKVITGNDATKHIPVIMLSGKDGFFDKVRGKMVGASNYITKPFDPAELTRTIAKFLKN